MSEHEKQLKSGRCACDRIALFCSVCTDELNAEALRERDAAIAQAEKAEAALTSAWNCHDCQETCPHGAGSWRMLCVCCNEYATHSDLDRQPRCEEHRIATVPEEKP